MNYTESADHSVHAPTGRRLHDDTKPVPTVLSADDINQLIWSLMAVVEDAGIPPQSFDPDEPQTYKVLLNALKTRFAQVKLEALPLAENGLGYATTEWVRRLLSAPTVVDMSSATARVELSRFDQQHVYAGTGNDVNLWTGLVEGAIYEMLVHVASQSDNLDMALRPNMTSYANQFYSCGFANNTAASPGVVSPTGTGQDVQNIGTAPQAFFYFDGQFGGLGNDALWRFTLKNPATKWKQMIGFGTDSDAMSVAGSTWKPAASMVWSTIGAFSFFGTPTAPIEYRFTIRRIA